VSVQPGRVGLGATPLFQIRPYIDLHNGFTTALSVRSSLHVVKWGGGGGGGQTQCELDHANEEYVKSSIHGEIVQVT